MPNTYTYTGPGTRWAEEDPTAEDYLNVARANADHLHEALSTIMDTDDADGLLAIIEQKTSVDANRTVATHGLSWGDKTVAAGVTVTLGASAQWVVAGGALTLGSGAAISFGSGSSMRILGA